MILHTASDTETAGKALATVLHAGDVVALSGPLGVGKSVLARGVLRGLGFAGDVPSPTFGLVIPYEPPIVMLPVWHCDLYRLEDPDDVEALALDEVLADGALLIEWPERMGTRLWPDALTLSLAVEGAARRLTADVPPSWEGRWPPPRTPK